MAAPTGKLTLAEAFARQEGFYAPGSRSARNCNPGDIRWGSFARQHGATHGDRPDAQTAMAVFPSDEVGFAAYRALLSVKAYFVNGKLTAGYLGATLEQVISRFAPPSQNNTEIYITNVCDWTGFARTDVLTLEML